MKPGYLLFAIVIIFLAIVQSHAQIILAPGEEKTLTDQPATGGLNGDNGTIGFVLGSNYDLSTKTIKAQANSPVPNSAVGKGEAFSLIYYDFQISETPETYNNTVGGWINYNVFWQGYQEIVGSLISNAIVKVEILINDQTTGKWLNNEIVHDFDIKTYSFLDVLVIGLNLNDSDEKFNSIPVVFVRGHQYRVHLKLTSTLLLSTPAPLPAFCDYMDGLFGGGDGRVELTNLFVKIGLDEKETLQKLALIDSLESRIDTLEYRLEHHYHTYLTGKGVGHNNTEASTTLSIFEEGSLSNTDPPQYETQPDLNSDENESTNLTPEVFSLSQNYPNPFNPSTKISFAVPTQELVTLKVYDILGRQVEVMMNETKSPGNYEINFNGDKLPSGTYIYEIRAGNFVETKKMVLLK